jgi:GNAT superfamily N-acetyltransferase
MEKSPMSNRLHPSIPDHVNVRCDLRPGDIGSVVSLHGVIYSREYGYDHTFEAYVAAGAAAFARAFSPHKDRLWIAEAGGQTIGSIAIVRRSESEAQLRWFLIHPNWRGLGLGRILLQRALQFCRECGYGVIFLWTISSLTVATHLYKSAGFKKTEEKASKVWGQTIIEERYDLQLESSNLPNLKKS